jgi:hypothetical protein
MRLDIVAEIEIAREPTDVASVMFDPAREPDWIQPVTGVEVLDPGIQPGARVRHSGSVMGRAVSWTTAVAAFQFPHLLVLDVVDAPFAGRVTYEVERAAGGSVARVRASGEAATPVWLPASLIEPPARQALSAALARLKAIVET